jgi:hypothetical protein
MGTLGGAAGPGGSQPGVPGWHAYCFLESLEECSHV